MFKKLLCEPLLHFLLIGASLFLIYGLQNDGITDQSKRIVFTGADINRLVLVWEKKRQRPPTQVELEGLIEQRIREEVMYREALAMGLDQNDSIVRRRLAQKVEFITADIAAQFEPTDAELEEYLARHTDKFEVPGRISFVHVYLNRDQRGENVQQDALSLLEQLSEPGSQKDIMTAGDPFMLGQQHNKMTRHDVSRLFGRDFTNRVFTLPPGSWQGPVSSGYGLHLVRIDDETAAVQPDLSAVRDKVYGEWQAQQRRDMDKAFYQSLRQRYEIIIENYATSNTVASDLVTKGLAIRANR
ncbi:MAG: peptidylprolyl isomerase [Gammaproteobacteria bacterium]|nr:MAG: peptidylprolyl isomerase [Gammaproteobacteria bacterium]